jgi:predicted MPP superfamily phosphohydrolase
LGGDLIDRRRALPAMQQCIRELAKLAAVGAIPANHDARVGLPVIRAAVKSAGGRWLPEHPFEGPVRIDGTVARAPAGVPRILCAHSPRVFPAAVRAGYRLVLAGHLHGGQCVLATVNDRLYPAAWFDRWHGLRFIERGTLLLVSRGVADTFPVRFNCPREVILCALS